MSFFLFKDRGEKTNQNNRKKSEDGHICQLIIIIIIIIINEEEEEDDDHEQNKQTKTTPLATARALLHNSQPFEQNQKENFEFVNTSGSNSISFQGEE
jgi:hypothetical protein